MANALKFLTLTLIALLIGACGGGGGGGGGGGVPVNSDSTPPIPLPPTTYVLQVSWTIPTTRENGDGLPIADLAGYQIYYFQDGNPDQPGTVISIDGGTTSSTQILIASPGTYYFAIAARDSDGLLSELSNYVTVTLN